MIVAVAGAQAQPSIPADLQQKLKDSHIFVFKDSVPAGEVRGLAGALTRQHGGQLGHVYTASIRGFSAKIPAAAAERLAAGNPNIAYYEKDGPAWAFQGPPGGGGGGGETTPGGVTRVGGPKDGTGLTAWIIDTGIDLDHPDLNVDTDRSANFANGSSADDKDGHGTHVAGTVAAIDNDIDVVGVAAGATVVAVRVLGGGGRGSISDVIAGVDYVAANAASGDAANMSLGGGATQSLDDAVEAAADNGILFSIAAGNDSDDANNYSPARVEHQNVWTVSAIDHRDDTFASFSNFGNPPIECAAPGVSVLSLYKGGDTATASGTSMSAPHVAGILLFGSPGSDGNAIDDPDGDPDPICHF
ncbi:MAG: S8 family serine peptidase [Alphaproteobacteria bacterium]